MQNSTFAETISLLLSLAVGGSDRWAAQGEHKACETKAL